MPSLSSPPLSHPSSIAEAGETSKPKKKKLPPLTRSPPSPPESVRWHRSREPPANRGYLPRRAISAVLCHGGTGTARAALSGSPSLSKFSCPLAVGIRLSPRFRILNCHLS